MKKSLYKKKAFYMFTWQAKQIEQLAKLGGVKESQIARERYLAKADIENKKI